MDLTGFLCTSVGVAACLAFIVWRAKHQLTIFVIQVDGGVITSVKGRLPRRLLGDITDAVRQERRSELRIRCRVEDGIARLDLYGNTDAGFEQLLRNLVGEYPLARLRQAPRAQRY